MSEDVVMAPDLLSEVLARLGWERETLASGRYEFWILPFDPASGVTVPLDASRGDYATLLNRAVNSVIRRHGDWAREAIDTARVVTSAGLVLTSWRKESAFGAGMIPLTQGEELVAAARRQLMAAARAAREPRPYHGKAGAHLAKRFADQSLLAQTGVGSFVLNAYSPAKAKFYFSEADEIRAITAPPTASHVTGQKVIDVLVSGLEAVRGCVDDFSRNSNLAVFSEAVALGVSSELVTSLAALSTDGEVAIRVGDKSQIRASVRFNSEETAVLSRAAESLKAIPDPVRTTIAGEVTILRSGSDEPFQTARLRVIDMAKLGSVVLRLSAEQYQSAIDAHETRRALHARGSLERDGKKWWLYHVESVWLGSALDVRVHTDHGQEPLELD